MAFNQVAFDKISGSFNTVVSNMWGYNNDTDTLATITASGYFNDVGTKVIINDRIRIVAIDGIMNVYVSDVDPNVTVANEFPGDGTGDVVGPASAGNGNIALYDGITGKLIKDYGSPPGTQATKNITSYAGNPNGFVAGALLDQVFDSTNTRLFMCTTAGNAAGAVWSIADDGGGDVVGPASAVDGNLVVFDGTSGKLIKDYGSRPGTAIATTKYVDANNGSNSAAGTVVGAYLTNTFAMASFSDNTTNKPYLIQFNGKSSETTFALKPFVTLNGYGVTGSQLALSGHMSMATTTGTASSTLSNFSYSSQINFDLSAMGAGAFTLNCETLTLQDPFTFVGRAAGNEILNISNSNFGLTALQDVFVSSNNNKYGDIAQTSVDADEIGYTMLNDYVLGNISVIAPAGKYNNFYVRNSALTGSVTLDGPNVTFYYDTASYPQNGFVLLNGAQTILISYLPNNTIINVNTFFGSDDSGTGNVLNPYKTVTTALSSVTDLTGTYNYLINVHGFNDTAETAWAIKPFVTINGYGSSNGSSSGLCDTFITLSGNITADAVIGTSGNCNFAVSNLTVQPAATNIDLSAMSPGAFSLNITNAEFKNGFTYKGRAAGTDNLTIVDSVIYVGAPIVFQDVVGYSANTKFSDVFISAVNVSVLNWTSKNDTFSNLTLTATGGEIDVTLRNSTVGVVTIDGANAFYTCDTASYPLFGFIFANGATLQDNVFIADVNGQVGNFTTSVSSNFGAINHIATAPAASNVLTVGVLSDWGSTITLGTAYQNTYGEDIIVKIGVLISSATAGQLTLGVGAGVAPTQDVIMPAITTAVQQLVSVDVRLPKNQYFILDKIGTLAQTNTFMVTGV